MAREGLMDDAGYKVFECDNDCTECDNKDCISNVGKKCDGTKTYENFDAWLADHDAKVRQDAIEEIERAMYHQCFEVNNDEEMQKWDSGNWIRYKLFENVMSKLKGERND